MCKARFTEFQSLAVLKFVETGLAVKILEEHVVTCWTDPTIVNISCPHDEACSKASGLTPPI